MTPDEHTMPQFLYDRVKGIMPQRHYLPDAKNPGKVREVGPGTPNAVAAHVLDTLDGNLILRQLSEQSNGKAGEPGAARAVRRQQGAAREDRTVHRGTACGLRPVRAGVARAPGTYP